MKIGIITFHRAYNLGAKLQAFALQDRLCRNHDAYILDYRCQKLEAYYYHPCTPTMLMRNAARFLLYPQYSIELNRRKRNYRRFDRRFRLSQPYTPETLFEANNDYDAFITGSDQVWNTEITGNDNHYFLDFADPEKRFSYAASIGNHQDLFTPDILDVLKSYRSILVREQMAADFLQKELPFSSIKVTVDPVFLLTKDEWLERMERKQFCPKRPYVLMYYVDQSHQTYAIQKAKNTAQKYGWDVLYVNGNKPVDKSIKYQNDVGPEEFVTLIANAKCVFTTSFHAMAFSLILNTPFFFELMKAKVNTSDRLKNLAQVFSVSEYEITNDAAVSLSTYPWGTVNQRIETLREYAVNEILSALEMKQ